MICPKKLHLARFVPMPELTAGYLRYHAIRKDMMEEAKRKGEEITTNDIDDIADELIEGGK